MNKKQIGLLAMFAMLALLIGWVNAPAAAQQQGSENLFQNPGFEAGYYNQDSISQIAVPNGWRMWWLDNVPFEGSEGLPAYRPETVVWYIQDAPANERGLFFRDGSYTLKVFKGYAPMYAAISQDVTGLQVGRSYRIVAPIFVDIVDGYENGQKVPPWRTDSGFVRFGVGAVGSNWLDGSQINYSPYWTAENVSPFYLTMPIFVWDFTATAENMTVWIEMGSRHPYSNSGFFMDGVGLYALDAVQPVSPPASSGSGDGGGAAAQPAVPPTPAPTPTPRADGSIVHIVQPNDTLWVIAVQYAPALGVTPEEALPLIQERNNNPAFINVGDELLILPPSEGAPVAAPVTEEEEEEAPVDEEAAAETPAATDEAASETEEDAAETGAEETAATDEPTEIAAAETAPAADAPNAICITVYEDVNGNGQQEAASEALLADAAVTVFRGGTAVSTYVSDGVSEPYCFQELEADTYQVQMFPPADYGVTTAGTWAVAVSNGATIPVAFGAQQSAGAPVSTDQTAENVTTTDSAQAPVVDGPVVSAVDDTAAAETAAAADEGGGFFSNLGGIVIGIAVVLVLLAGLGVFLLRRG